MCQSVCYDDEAISNVPYLRHSLGGKGFSGASRKVSRRGWMIWYIHHSSIIIMISQVKKKDSEEKRRKETYSINN